MRHRLRFLLTICLALALPMQGIASVVMWHCGPAHAQGADAASQPGPAHHAQASDAAPDAQEPACDQHRSPHAKGAFKVSCSACASCCVGVAMTTAMPVLPSVAPTCGVLTAADEAAPVGITADGLERPPRPHAA